MIVHHSTHPTFVSNCYLVADRAGGSGVFIDAGGPIEPLLEWAQELDLTITHLLNTHEHADHTAHNLALQERYDIPLLSPDELSNGDEVRSGDLTIRAISTPGHVPDHLAFVVNDEAIFTGDLIFRSTVGGTLGGGPEGYAQLRHSIMDVVMALPHELVVHPGHADATTLAREWDENPFVRVWRGLDDEGTEIVEVAGNEATLIVWATDYDGGNKAWVRFADGRDAVVGGSRVQRSGVTA